MRHEALLALPIVKERARGYHGRRSIALLNLAHAARLLALVLVASCGPAHSVVRAIERGTDSAVEGGAGGTGGVGGAGGTGGAGGAIGAGGAGGRSDGPVTGGQGGGGGTGGAGGGGGRSDGPVTGGQGGQQDAALTTPDGPVDMALPVDRAPDIASAPTTITINPQADAHVREGQAGTNFGGETSMEVKNSTAAGNNRNAFARFSLTGVGSNVISAKVRLFGSSETSAKVVSVFAVADITWSEGNIDWDNQPAIGAKQGSGVNIALTARYVEFDVTAYVRAQKGAGATAVSFALRQDNGNNETPTSFDSKEGTNKPELVVQSQ
jgi:hypothetical protein